MGAKKSKEVLSRDELEYIMDKTKLEEHIVKKWYVGFLRDYPNGKMTQETFYQMYQILFPGGSTEKFCYHVFRTFDTDHNGYIDFVEFLLAINITSSGTPEEKLKWVFKLYDVDGNGTISQNEMTKVVQSMYDMLAPEESKTDERANEKAKEVFQQLDLNGDLVLSEDEFVKGCMMNESLKSLLTGLVVDNNQSEVKER